TVLDPRKPWCATSSRAGGPLVPRSDNDRPGCWLPARCPDRLGLAGAAVRHTGCELYARLAGRADQSRRCIANDRGQCRLPSLAHMVDGRTPSMAGARTGADGYLLPGLDRAQHCAAADLLQLFRVLPRVLSDG